MEEFAGTHEHLTALAGGGPGGGGGGGLGGALAGGLGGGLAGALAGGLGSTTKEQMLLARDPLLSSGALRQTNVTPGLRYRNLGKSGLRVSNVGLGEKPASAASESKDRFHASVLVALMEHYHGNESDLLNQSAGDSPHFTAARTSVARNVDI
ncbi:Voltage-gated potassium channel subunit beta-3 [Frankliniella fusca]|uniref:Voltage-gated potassium channel subunit beta-3 n=1 Tax=Frankliniella fusca TaxID=407009 RepID=A0AAE1LAK7_9NEOP|nr:Voltage-gated potassium channel subunit beta-3 [Frankliniella fusca]